VATAAQPGAYESLGGAAGVDAAVHRFYELVLADGELAPYFTDVDLVRLHAHQVAFLSAAVGGPRDYTGRSLASAHAGMHIPRAAFDRVLDHLVDALGEAGVDAALIETIIETLTTLEAEVAGRR
jgi:hemoglobin